jgi:hypothetical protein
MEVPRGKESFVKTAVKWMAFGAGVGSAVMVGRAMIGNAAGVVAAVLSDFEARRTDLPSTDGAHHSTRTPTNRLPARLKADIDYARSASAKQVIDLVESPAPLAR